MKTVIEKVAKASLIAMVATVTGSFAAPTPSKSGHAAVNGLNYYYAVYGTGEPLLLLHTLHELESLLGSHHHHGRRAMSD